MVLATILSIVYIIYYVYTTLVGADYFLYNEYCTFYIIIITCIIIPPDPGKKGKDSNVHVPEAPSVPIPTKQPTQMKKRGVEDVDSKYLSESRSFF